MQGKRKPIVFINKKIFRNLKKKIECVVCWYSFLTHFTFAYNTVILDGWFVYDVYIHGIVNGGFFLMGRHFCTRKVHQLNIRPFQVFHPFFNDLVYCRDFYFLQENVGKKKDYTIRQNCKYSSILTLSVPA